MNRKHWTAVLCLGLATLVGGDRLVAADADQMDKLKGKMTKEGWTEVADGVFERPLGENKVERLGYGREGFAWTVGELTRRLEFFQKERELYPSEKLDKMIGDLTMRLGKTRRALWNMDHEGAPGLSSLAEAAVSCGSICYSATADAYPLTASQGVAAVANASFNSACGYSGETYAYSYARATLGTTTTIHSQSDPDFGTSITSAASSTVNGGSVTGIPCYSEASSYAQSSALGISYSTSDTNSDCPVPPCTVTITGTGYEYFSSSYCVSRTWSVSLSSGCPSPTSYQWTYNGTVVGSGSTYTRTVCAGNYNFTLGVTVNGAYSDTHPVTVVYEEPPPCECCNLPPGHYCP